MHIGIWLHEGLWVFLKGVSHWAGRGGGVVVSSYVI